MCRTIAVLSIGLSLTSPAAGRDPGGPHGAVVRPRGRIELEVEYPPDGAVVNGSACGVFVAGRALAVSGESARLDVVIVLDTSLSTIDASGADIDGDGVVGRPLIGRFRPDGGESNSDPGDSVLAAEVTAAVELMRGLDLRRTRLAVVTFAGEVGVHGQADADPRLQPAATVEPLTFDHARIVRALGKVLGRQPSGHTHMAAGVTQATRTLVEPASLSADPGAEKVVVFFTDGQPTLPYGPASERENVLAVLDAAARVGVRIHSFAIGPKALEGPVAVVEMAARTGGSFTPVPRPGSLVELMRDVRFASLSDVSLRNATTGAQARPFRLAADGSWIGFLKLDPGHSRIEAAARTESGAAALRALDIRLDPDMPAWVKARVPQTRGLSLQHNRFLKDIFKGAATTVITQRKKDPIHARYERLLDGGTKPTLAKLSLARMIAATVLRMWKNEEEYDPGRAGLPAQTREG